MQQATRRLPLPVPQPQVRPPPPVSRIPDIVMWNIPRTTAGTTTLLTRAMGEQVRNRNLPLFLNLKNVSFKVHSEIADHLKLRHSCVKKNQVLETACFIE